MFQALIAFITVLSGYVFVSTWHRTRYLLLRQPSQRIYFRAAFWGIWLFLLALSVALLLKAGEALPLVSIFSTLPNEILDAVFDGNREFAQVIVATLGLVLLLGVFGGFALNWFELLWPWPADWRASLVASLKGEGSVISVLYGLTSRRPLRRAIEYLNADFERILLKALREEKPVCLSMADRKVYVGYLSGAVDPSDINDMVRILPYMSGFRGAESLEMVFTDFYDLIYSQAGELAGEGPCEASESLMTKNADDQQKDEAVAVDQSDFELALPIRDIRSCRLFDTGSYLKYQRARHNSELGFMAR